MTAADRRRYDRIARLMSELSKEMQRVAIVLRDDVTEPKLRVDLIRIAGDADDMSAMLLGEMPDSDAAVSHGLELNGSAGILREWAARPTDWTGNKGRSAQLMGVAAALESWAEGMRK